jgi:hypothetical protein
MKRYIPIILLFILVNGCEIDKFEYEKPDVIESLKIDSIMGIKLETPFVEDIVKMNVKTKTSDNYIITIVDIVGRTLSKSEINVKEGDNVINLYTRTLPPASYRIKLENKNGDIIGYTDFNKIN